jgi:hypothetical protein
MSPTIDGASLETMMDHPKSPFDVTILPGPLGPVLHAQIWLCQILDASCAPCNIHWKEDCKMNEMLNIDLFKKLLTTDNSENTVLEAIKKLADVDKASEFSDRMKGPKPLGSWTGWSF